MVRGFENVKVTSTPPIFVATFHAVRNATSSNREGR